MERLDRIEAEDRLRQRVVAEQARYRTAAMICGGTGCPASTAPLVPDALEGEGDAQGLGNCEAQLAISAGIEDTCVGCEPGKGFPCSRHTR